MNLERIGSYAHSRHRWHNLSAYLLRERGHFLTDNGYTLRFDRASKEDVTQLFELANRHGVIFDDAAPGSWRVDHSRNLVILPNGLRFHIDRFHAVIFAETFLYDIHYSEGLAGKTVVQAGGFVGDTAIYYASRGATCYSFEPDPASFSLAERNLALNPELSDRVVLRNYAIGKDGFARFPVNESGSGKSSTFATEGRATVDVRSIGIGTLLDEFRIEDPYLLDLDIKGNEFDVIDDEAISRFHKVRIEYSPELAGKKHEGLSILGETLRRHGFTVLRTFKHNYGRWDLRFHGTLEAVRNGDRPPTGGRG